MNRYLHSRFMTPAVAGVAVGTMLLTGCSPGGGSDSSSSADAGSYNVNVDDCLDPGAATEPVGDTWNIGFSLPLSGPIAGVVKPALDGYKARIELANKNNELDGVKIEVKYLDDAFAPDRAKANVTELIQKDGVDSIEITGSGNVGAVADDQNAACVPLLYASSSVDQYRDLDEYPWTIQYSPSADNEASFDIALLESKFPDGATVGIAENQTESGKAFTEAFTKAAEGTNIEIALTTPSTDPNAAATDLKAVNPDVVYYAAVPSDCGPMTTALGRVGFTPKLILAPTTCVDKTGWIAAGDAAEGVIVPTWIKDPASSGAANDPGVAAFVAAVAAEDKANPQTAAGWLLADLTIMTLKKAAASPNGLTRASVIDAARDADYQAPMAIDGVKWISTPDEMLGWNNFQTQAWDTAKQSFVPEGDLVPVGG